jgi:prepilin-type N-terminal cleavage/methylation domain-containing protein
MKETLANLQIFTLSRDAGRGQGEGSARATGTVTATSDSQPSPQPSLGLPGEGVKRARCRVGFTLIEVIAAMLVVAIVIPVTSQAIITSLAAASRARHLTEATSLAQAQLDELVASGTWNSASMGDFGVDHPGYRWTCQNVAWDYGSYQVMLSVYWTERSQERSLSLTTIAYSNPAANAAFTTGATP